MSFQLHEIAPTVKVRFDDIQGKLIIYNLHTPIPGFKGEWQKTTEFSSAQEWYESHYAKMKCSEYIEDMIMWFWIDHDVSITK